MAEILGTQLVAGIVPFTTEDQYPTHFAKYGKGGLRTVETIAERDAIPEQRKDIGMIVFVKENKKTYRLMPEGWVELENPEEVLSQAKEYTDQWVLKDYNHVVTNKVDIISAKKRLGTLSEYQLQCQLNGSTVRAFSLADISAKEFENTRQAIWNKTAEQTGMYAGIFCAGSTAGLGALKLTLHNTETNLTDIHYLCFVEDTPSQGAFLFVTTCEWNIEIRHISNKLFAYLQVPDSFAGSVIVQAVRCNIKSGGSWNAFQTDGNSYTDLCSMYNYSAQNLYTDGQKFNLELCQSLYGNVVDNSSFITPFGRYKTDIIYDFGTLEVGSKISDLVVNDSILHDLSKKVSSLSEKMTEIPESLAQYPTNEQIDEKLQNLPTNEQLTETLGGYATHEELENAKSEIDGSMQSMQGSIETMQYDIDQAKADAGSAQSAADSAYQRAEEAYNYAMGIVVPPDCSYEVQQAQSRADEAYTRADEAYYKADSITADVATAQQAADTAQQRAEEAYSLASDASGCLIEMIYLMLLPFMLVRMVVYNSLRFFFTMPVGDYDGTPIGDQLFYYIYLVQKGRKDELPSEISKDIQLLMYGDRKCNICVDEQMNTFLPTLDVSGINYLNDNLEIVFTDEVTGLFAQYLGIPDIAALRIVDPVQIDGEDCYWALVMKDGNVLNPGEYELNPSI